MKTNYEDWIEDYIEGVLPESDKERFENELKSNDDLKNKCRERTKLHELWTNAARYEATKEEVIGAIKKGKNKKRLWIRNFSIAASVIVVVSLSIVLFLNNEVEQTEKLAEDENTLQPKINLPENKASGGELQELVLLKPANDTLLNGSESIVFEWTPELKDSSAITILDVKTDSLMFKESILPNQNKFMLKENTLPPGNYFWFIQKTDKKESFTIIE